MLHTVITCSNSLAYNYNYAIRCHQKPNKNSSVSHGNPNGIIYNL